MQKNPGATLRPIFDFGYPGRVALPKHGGALRLHDHHASKHAAIGLQHIAAALHSRWLTSPHRARRALAVVLQVMRYARAKAYATRKWLSGANICGN
jgi:hypothetical protein